MLKWLTRACFDFIGFSVQQINISSTTATELDAATTYNFDPSFPFSLSFSVVSLRSNKLILYTAYHLIVLPSNNMQMLHCWATA